jgi:hypothetical protein
MQLPFLGKRKEQVEESKGRGFVPTERVSELMSRGFSELDTIDVLRREGFSPDEIDKGLTQAIKEGVVGNPGQEDDSFGGNENADDFEKDYQKFRSEKFGEIGGTKDSSKGGSFPPKRQEPKEEVEMRLPTMEDLELPTATKTGSVPEIPETTLPEEYYEGYPTGVCRLCCTGKDRGTSRSDE